MFRPRRDAGASAPPPTATSNDAIAVTYDDGAGALVVAAFGAGDGDATDARALLSSCRFSLSQTSSSLAAGVREWLREIGGAENFARLILPVEDFSERTRVFPLEDEERALPHDGLAAAVVSAADGDARDAQGNSIFERPIDTLACDIARLPDGDISFTAAPRDSVERVVNRLGNTFARSSHEFVVETRLRAALRYWLLAERGQARGALTAFFLVNSKGSTIGLWSAERGLFKEDGEEFVLDDAGPSFVGLDLGGDITESLLGPGEDFAPAGGADALKRAALTHAVEFAVSKLAKKLTPAKLEEYGFAPESQVQIVWAASPELASFVASQMGALEHPPAHSGATAFRCVHLRAALEEAVTQGLLLGSVYEQPVPAINLSGNLRDRARDYEVTALSVVTAQESRSRTAAALAVVAPFAVVLAVLAASLFFEFGVGIRLASREAAAKREAARLKPLADKRQGFVNTFTWMQSYVQQIIELRKRQGAAIGLYADLNARFPVADDPTFYASQVKLDPGGALELKGFTKRKEALTALVNSMESATSVYANVKFEIAEGTQPGASPPPGVQLPPSAVAQAGSLAPGVISWTITAMYKPLADAGQQKAAPASAANRANVPPMTAKNTAGGAAQ